MLLSMNKAIQNSSLNRVSIAINFVKYSKEYFCIEAIGLSEDCKAALENWMSRPESSQT